MAARDRSYGFVETPLDLVEFMVGLVGDVPSSCSVLEPGCGDGRFLLAFRDRYGSDHRFVGVDIRDSVLAGEGFEFVCGDYLLWEPDVCFDVVIGNPPYGIVGDASHYPIHVFKQVKDEYRRRLSTWRGKYNLYGAFIEKSVRLLASGGVLVFVVPTTWLVLDDFVLLRRFLAERGGLDVYYVGRVFPKVNVSAVVLRFELGGRGLRLYDVSDGVWRESSANEPSVDKPSWDGGLIRFETDDILEFERSGIALGDLFHIHFAARSPEFRKSGLVRQVPKQGDVPVLTGRNLAQGSIDYEGCYSGWWMRREDAVRLRSFYGVPHLVVGHTKGSRLVCGVDWRCYPWREEYHLVPLEDKRVDWDALETYLSSEPVQNYLSFLYRDFTPHITRTILSRVPLVGWGGLDKPVGDMV